MLARPEFGTREHFMLWLAAKKADETFNWSDPLYCACGKYHHEHGIMYVSLIGSVFETVNEMAGLVAERRGKGYFSDLYRVLDAVWR